MIRFEIPGMTCGGCVRAITNAIQSVDTHAKVETDVPARQVNIESSADSTALIAAIKDAGYEARVG